MCQVTLKPLWRHGGWSWSHTWGPAIGYQTLQKTSGVLSLFPETFTRTSVSAGLHSYDFTLGCTRAVQSWYQTKLNQRKKFCEAFQGIDSVRTDQDDPTSWPPSKGRLKFTWKVIISKCRYITNGSYRSSPKNLDCNEYWNSLYSYSNHCVAPAGN